MILMVCGKCVSAVKWPMGVWCKKGESLALAHRHDLGCIPVPSSMMTAKSDGDTGWRLFLVENLAICLNNELLL